jgi:uncharacterized protein YbjQ (UPF0145 family)
MNFPILTTGYYNMNKYEPIGLVSSIPVHSISAIRGLVSGITGFFGGRQQVIEKNFLDIRKEALYELEQEAKAMGAVMIIGLEFDVSELGNEFVIYGASGTALKLKSGASGMKGGIKKEVKSKKDSKVKKNKKSNKDKKKST